MPTATITSKWQLTLPKEIRQALKLKYGDKVKFLLKENGECILESVNKDIKELKVSFIRTNGSCN